MKEVNSDELRAYQKAIGTGFLEGAALGAPLSYALLKYTDKKTNFKNAGVFPRTLAIGAPIIFLGITMLDQHSRQFDAAERRAHMHLHGKQMDPEETTLQKIKDYKFHPANFGRWLSDNRYKVIVGGWAACLAGSFWAVNRDPYMTRSQKIVQARVYAQGATVLMLVGSVLLSARANSKQNTAEIQAQEHATARDSWKRDLAYIREEK